MKRKYFHQKYLFFIIYNYIFLCPNIHSHPHNFYLLAFLLLLHITYLLFHCYYLSNNSFIINNFSSFFIQHFILYSTFCCLITIVLFVRTPHCTNKNVNAICLKLVRFIRLVEYKFSTTQGQFSFAEYGK